MNRFFRSALFPLVVIVLLVWLASQTLIPHSKSAAKVTYSGFLTYVQNHQVRTAEFNPSKHSLSFVLTSGKKGSVHYPADQSVPELTQAMETHGVNFDSKGTGGFSWLGILVSMLPFVILIAFWIFLMNQVQGGGSKVMSFGKSRAKRMAPDSPKIGFKDVAGVDEAVEVLQDI
jgi:cell division protease FtsH